MYPNFVVKQFLNGNWVDLINVPVINEKEPSKKDIEDSIAEIKDLIFESEKCVLTVENEAVVFNRLDGPIKIKFEED